MIQKLAPNVLSTLEIKLFDVQSCAFRRERRRITAEGVTLNFVIIVKNLISNVLSEALAAVDLTTAEENWSARLRGKVVERHAVTALLDAASSVPEPLANVIADLRRRFPDAVADSRKQLSSGLQGEDSKE